MGEEKKRTRKYLVLFWLFVLAAIIAPFCLIWFVASGNFGALPTFEELENPKSNLASEIFSEDGQQLGKYYIQNRSNVSFENLEQNLVNALIATEDIRFEDHSGVDLRGLLRVLVKTILFQQSSGGGSTITQQLAKNLFPREKLSAFRLVIRKMQEWVIAVKLERNYTKQEIISMYLNTVPFGSNAFGIKSAARTFFNTTQDSLRIEQSAVLIGLLKAPSWYSPVRNEERSRQRRNTVMSQMKRYDFITEVEYDSLKVLPIELEYSVQDHQAGQATYFREYLRGVLVEWCKNQKRPDDIPYNLYKDGLRIYTTINSKMQRYAEEAVAQHLGGELQPQFFKHWKGRKNAPFWNVSSKERQNILNGAKKMSGRYMVLVGKECSNCGRRGKYIETVSEKGIDYYQCSASDCMQKQMATDPDSINFIFDTPVAMKIFSWDGDIDTTMSPMDSILYYKHFLHSGFMSMDPHTGYVKAWVGGINYKHFQFDHVKLGKRQVGSTFKPFVYSLALAANWSPCIPIPNVPITFKVGEFGLERAWTPRNADDGFDDLMLSLRFGMANSINYITAYVMKQFNPQAVIKLATDMGITSYLDPYPSICLGTSDVSVYDMVGAYGTFANKGVWTQPIVVTKIVDSKGNVLEEFIPEKREVMNEKTATLMLHMLQGVVDGVYSPAAQKRIGTGVRLRFKYKFANQIAAKTGTTQNYSDGWFMGVTPNLVSGVWTGCEDRSAHFRNMYWGQGATTALPIWAFYMQKVYADSTLGISREDKFDKIPANKLGVEINCARYRDTHANEYGDKPIDFDQ